MTKYEKWYASITQNAKNRILTTYTETHHIVPRSLGGTDDSTNLVALTAREHFICHWLLAKMHIGQNKHKMINALRMMKAEKQGQERYKTKITARVYESFKEEYAQLQSIKFTGKGNGFYGKKHTPEAIARIKAANIGRVQPEEEKQKQIAAMTGRKREEFSEEWKAKLSAAKQGANNNMFGKKHSEEAKAKQSAKAIGRKQSEETKQKKADAIRGLKREKQLCLHCNQEVAVNGYARWHGDKCKHNPAGKQ